MRMASGMRGSSTLSPIAPPTRAKSEPWPRYGAQALRSWVQRAREAWPADADVFVYFNNDQHAAALYDAAAFASIARRAGLQVTPAPEPEK